jgi:protein-L-isoaspartate(D-aspartate) O-methyltransferase
MTDFALARRNMVDGQLRPNRVTNAALLAAVGELPRERFLPDGLKSVAYADDDVPLGSGRFMMEPMVLARLIQSLQPQPEDKALVAASGRGYGAAILAQARQVGRGRREADAGLAAVRPADSCATSGVSQISSMVAGPAGPGRSRLRRPYDVVLIEGRHSKRFRNVIADPARRRVDDWRR